MRRVVSNQDFLWKLVRSTKKEFKVFIINVSDEQYKCILECLINCNLEKNILSEIRKYLSGKKISKIIDLILRKQDSVKTSIAIVLTEVLSSLNNG